MRIKLVRKGLAKIVAFPVERRHQFGRKVRLNQGLCRLMKHLHEVSVRKPRPMHEQLIQIDLPISDMINDTLINGLSGHRRRPGIGVELRLTTESNQVTIDLIAVGTDNDSGNRIKSNQLDMRALEGFG